MNQKPETPWAAYALAFRRDVHQLIAWGHSDSRHLISANSDETEITGYIKEAISRRLDDPSTPESFSRYEVHDDPPLPTEGRTGRRRRRADLQVTMIGSKPRPKYIWETKRFLKTNSHETYIGCDGILRFITNAYAANYPEAGMLGYIQTQNVTKWENSLIEILATDPSVSGKRLLDNKLFHNLGILGSVAMYVVTVRN